MKLILTVFLFLFLTSVFSQTNYYVATTGDNLNDGSMASPWAGVQFGLDAIASGDTLNLFGGVFIEKVDFPISGITLRNVAGENPIIDASLIDPQDAVIEIYNVSDITVDGIEIQNNIRNNSQGILVEGNCQNITIQNCVVHDIHFSDNPDDNPSPSKNAQAIIVYGSDPATAISDLIIRNNEIYNCRLGYSEGLAVNGNVDGFEVSGNYVHDLTNIGIDVIGHENTCATDSLDQARNGVVSNNIVHNCISVYASSGGLYTDGGKNILFEYNVSYRNGYGIEIGCENGDKTTDSIVVRNNLFYDNQVCGIAMGGYDYPSSGKVTNSIIRNNSCLKNDFNNEGYGEFYLSYSEDCVIENNIFYTSATNILTYSELTQPGLVFDYNLIFSESGSLEVDWNGDFYNNYDAFVTGSGYNTNGLFADPLYVSTDILAVDLHVAITSPAIHAGNPATVIGADETDFDGNDRVEGTAIDCGAYETMSIPESIVGVDFSFTYFPNPVHSLLYLETSTYWEQADLYDAFGRQVATFQNTTDPLDLSGYTAGIYHLALAFDGGRYTVTLVIQ